jgi:hypothetical protein
MFLAPQLRRISDYSHSSLAFAFQFFRLYRRQRLYIGRDGAAVVAGEMRRAVVDDIGHGVTGIIAVRHGAGFQVASSEPVANRLRIVTFFMVCSLPGCSG